MKAAVVVSVAAAWFFATAVVDYYKQDQPAMIGYSLSQICALIAAWMWGL